jgi:hypothetical protein
VWVLLESGRILRSGRLGSRWFEFGCFGGVRWAYDRSPTAVKGRDGYHVR